jgi:murein DD-endopeptidase MepM/ murein hydrolase activator NlpD
MKRYVLVPLDRRRQVRGNALVGVLAAAALAIVSGMTGAWLEHQGLLNMEIAGAPAKESNKLPLSTPADGEQQQVDAEIDAVAGQVGEMQAEILRLNALGERLVQMAGLNESEFDFRNPPPQGGPDTGLSARPPAIDALAEELAEVLSSLDDRKQKLTLLEELIMERHLGEQSTPSGWPVRSGYISSTFGFRKDPFHGRGAFHKGVDFAGKRGAPVIAVADGVVTFSGTQSGYGNLVEIRHKDGLVTRYGHCQKRLVKEGDLIAQGQTIATIGSTGRSTGPHVHFEVLVSGRQVDPLNYIDRVNVAADTRPGDSATDG